MSVRKGFVLLFALSALTFLVACGGNGTTIANQVPPPSGSFSNSNLNGTYVFSVSGIDANGEPYAFVGAFTANGNGGVTGGTIDINDQAFASLAPPIGPIANSPIGGSSSYGVSVDGRGTAKLTTNTPVGTIQLDFVLQNNSHGLVTEFDNNGTGSGTLDLQSSDTTPRGAYAFSFSGASGMSSIEHINPFATVGNFILGSGGAIISGLADFNFALGTGTNIAVSGTVVAGPSSTPGTQLATGELTTTYDVYPIDATHLKFIEMDRLGTLSGDAFSQTSTSVPTGTLAFTLQSGIESVFVAGGFMVTDGAGNITNASTEDVNNNGTVSATATFSAQYTAAGTGRFILNNFSNFVGGTEYAAYPSSGGLLLLEIDNSGLTLGAAYGPQSSTTFAAPQGYGLNLSGTNRSGFDIAEFTAASSGSTVTGIVDEISSSQIQSFDQALSGTYTAPDSNGRGTITATASNNSNSTLNGDFGLTFYTVDGTTFPFIESDSGQVAAGVFFLQSTPGGSAAIANAHNMFVPLPIIRPHANRTKQKQTQK